MCSIVKLRFLKTVEPVPPGNHEETFFLKLTLSQGYLPNVHSEVQRFSQIYAVYWPEDAATSHYSVFIGQFMQLVGSYWPEQVA